MGTPNAATTVSMQAGKIVCKTIVPTTSAQSLTAIIADAAVPSGCKRIKLMAPTTGTPGNHANTSDVLYGDSAVLNDRIATDGSRDAYVHISSTDDLYIKSISNGDKLEIRLEL